MIYKKIIYVLIFFVFMGLSSNAIEKASIKYDEDMIDYKKLDAVSVLKEADAYFNQYLTTQDKKYLSTSMGKYYILTKINPIEMYYNVQLARTYDFAYLDRLAKQYFSVGYDINKRDPFLNYHHAEFYNRRNDYKKALRFYKIAYNYGYSENYDLNFKIATIYEKFADLKNARYYYEKAYSINPNKKDLYEKILLIKSLNYEQSQYYH